MDGWRIFCFKEKLKKLKEKLKIWNVEVFGNVETKVKRLVGELNQSDALARVRLLSDEEIRLRRSITEDLSRV